jgi:hypothetical protein
MAPVHAQFLRQCVQQVLGPLVRTAPHFRERLFRPRMVHAFVPYLVVVFQGRPIRAGQLVQRVLCLDRGEHRVEQCDHAMDQLFA